jgi:hypothetical protein
VRTREQDGCRHGYWPRRPILVGAVSAEGVSVSESRGVGVVAQAMKVVWGDEGLDMEEGAEADGDGDGSSIQSDSSE